MKCQHALKKVTLTPLVKEGKKSVWPTWLWILKCLYCVLCIFPRFMTNELSNFATDAELVFNTQGQIWVLPHRKFNTICSISEVNAVFSQKDFLSLALWFLTGNNITNLSFLSEGKVECEQNDIWDLHIINSRKCFSILNIIFTGYSSSSYKITSAGKSEIGYMFAILPAKKWVPFSLERNISLWQ